MANFFGGGSGRTESKTATELSPELRNLQALYGKTVQGVYDVTGGLAPFLGGSAPTWAPVTGGYSPAAAGAAWNAGVGPAPSAQRPPGPTFRYNPPGTELDLPTYTVVETGETIRPDERGRVEAAWGPAVAGLGGGPMATGPGAAGVGGAWSRAPGSSLFTLSPEEGAFRQLVMEASRRGPAGLEAVLPGLRALFARASTPWAPTPEMAQGTGAVSKLLSGEFDPQSVDTLKTLLASAMGGPSALENEGLTTLAGRIDPTLLLDSVKAYIEKIAGPEARAASVAGGMGGVRGGAFQEGLAREGARFALPIAQMVQAAKGELAGAQMGVGAGLEARRAGLTSLLESMRAGRRGERAGYASQLFGMGAMGEELGQRRMGLAGQIGDLTGRFGQAADLQRLGMLQTGQEAAGMPRLLALQDFLRQQNLAATALLGIPVFPSGTTTGKGSYEKDLTLMDLLAVVGPIAGAAMGGGFSSAKLKKGIQPLDPDEYERARLKVKDLPIARWRYKWEDDDRVPHIGPIAELSPPEIRDGPLKLSFLDTAGLTLAAVKGVDRRVDRLEGLMDTVHRGRAA